MTESAATGETGTRELRYVASPYFIPLLAELQASLLVSTYQAGKVLAIGTHANALEISLHSFELAMGIAIHANQVAVGARGIVWQLKFASDIASQLEPAGKYDNCLLTRQAYCTGNIHAHDLAYIGDKLWAVNTLFSCLCTLEANYSFVPQWKPKFISNCHVAGDRCHLNGMAVHNGQPAYATAFAETDIPNGWRPSKHKTGLLIDIASQEIICRGLAMPHSPRMYNNQLFLLDSGRGALVKVDVQSGKQETITIFPGYTRGLSFCGPFAFVGLSRIRETAVFGGLPISTTGQELFCGIGVVDLRSGQQVASLRFVTGVEELFAVEILPNIRCPAVRGPHAEADEHSTVWVVPEPKTRSQLS